MSDSQKPKRCSGCRDNFYNGNNQYGIEKCWCLENATLMLRKKVHINQVPPWTQKPEKYLSCYGQKGYVFIDCSKEDRQY